MRLKLWTNPRNNMFRFFRTLRQSLLPENRVSKYLPYAIGEIALVVIGILIALQVNTWNQERLDSKAETAYLRRLLREIEGDLENISSAVKSYEGRKKRAEFLMATKTNPGLAEADPTYFIESIEYAGYTNSPVVADHTYEEIKSSGRLSIITNEQLRTSLSGYYTGVKNREQYNFIVQDIQLRYLEYRAGILSDEQQIAMGSMGNEMQYDAEAAAAVYKRMMAKTAFIDHLPFVIQSKVRAIEVLKARHDSVLQLRRLILEELQPR